MRTSGDAIYLVGGYRWRCADREVTSVTYGELQAPVPARK